tara:strand:- start:2524 stop:4278 length:1755 start_codon:yes stop_codon:yes gene_type:complete
LITLNYTDKGSLAGSLAGKWHEWNSARTQAMELWSEIDSYLHATDTSMLEGGDSFDHKTHLPVLSELHEDLLAIVYSTMFPHDDWLGWKGFDINAITKAVRSKVLSYVKQCHSLNGFSQEMRKAVDDLVRYGNCFTQVHYQNQTLDTEEGVSEGYIGPVVKRLSPFDIVFNPVASSFAKTPKLIRSLVTLGELVEFVDSISDEDLEVSDEQLKRLLTRRTGSGNDYTERYKEKQFIPQGFGSIQEYYTSGYIELLWFYGDIFDDTTGDFHKKRCIVVADRDTVLLDREESRPAIFKGSWTARPDNLWSQGPLDKVVGINYMINHRENGKNDAIDKFIYPDRAYVGDVEEIYDEVTGHTKYIMPEGGSVSDIRPDSTVLTFDNQIMMHRELARTSARLPQQLAGFRTAGEKTATEVQSLNDGAFRGFINKVAQVEEDLVEPMIQAEIRIAKDNFASIIKVLEEDEDGIMLTTSITEEDLSANGKLVPHGSRRFSRQLQQLSGLNQLANSNLIQVLGPHINTYQLSKTFEELNGFDKFGFVNKFASVDEQLEMQEKQMLAEQEMVKQSSEPTMLEMEMEAGDDFEE